MPMARLSSLRRDISPPPRRNSGAHLRHGDGGSQATATRSVFHPLEAERDTITPSLAAIEAGEARIRDHLEYFARHLEQVVRPVHNPRLSIADFAALYERNQHKHGRHFVVHQHDHPVSGVHYDLRLQFSDSSALSFAIPYGLPGNPNSVRPIRMAVETRVHNIWNNLIETASHTTGSLLIWDTGEYEILPWKETKRRGTDDELSDGRPEPQFLGTSQSERLVASFQRRRIRLRLRGSKLPTDYTVSMWLTSSNDRDRQPGRPKRKRRRVDTRAVTKRETTTSDEDESGDDVPERERKLDTEEEDEAAAAVASDTEEDATIRANNAYPGAFNTIGSVHQRNWFLTLDRKNSGFKKARSGLDQGRWIDGFEPFFVLGRDHERSVVTGRNADEVMEDAEVEKFVGRKMWQPILK